MNANRFGSSPSKRLSALLKPEAVEAWRIPLPGALPIRMDPAGAREAVLLLHGFMGYPGELEPLANGLAGAGYAVSVPRLPGHGTGRRDFLLTGAEDWARRAYDAYLELRAEYEIVHVGGHSMGGLLASSIAVSFGLPRLILLAPVFELSIRLYLAHSSHRSFQSRDRRQANAFGLRQREPGEECALRRILG